MHAAVMDFVRRVRQKLPGTLSGVGVEVGSFNMNGTARGLFGGLEWTGFDARPGPGVDIAGTFHEEVHKHIPSGTVSVVLATEVLEHDPHWKETLQSAVSLLSPGGALIMTWASPARGAHELECSPIPGHYHAPGLQEVMDHLRSCGDFSQLEGEVVRKGLDVQLWAIASA